MCRNIRTLFNFEPPATEAEIRAASLQFVRKVSGSTKPSKVNEASFNSVVDEIAAASSKLITANGPHEFTGHLEKASGRKVLSMIAATLEELQQRG